ncbi:MAG: nucleoside recognition domain-containing protein [Sediminibacterium sp.]|nr:spore maturation protein [Chitinophagaceae bacterium]MCA6446339.1 spore maturation protein [Chitinophagaceae bacterium]
MALSRFWLVIILGSITYILALLFSGNYYSIEFAVNGKKDDPLLKKEVYLSSLPQSIQDTLKKAKEGKYAVGKDSLYILDNSVVKICVGKQATDGILPTAKNTIFDLLLPLIAYLSFFCGILQLLIDSGASQRLAKLLSPIFIKVFPEIPKDHPAISYMMLNFAANFLGLDSAATPFGLKAMESLQEINPDKDKASNSQIMFMCLHAAGLTLIPTSIIGYRAAQHAANPADVMLPCIITSFVGTIAALVIVGIRQRIKLLNITLVISIGAVVGIITGLLFYITRLDLISKAHFTGNLSNVLLLGIIFIILAYSFLREKRFTDQGKNIFNSFVEGAYDGLKTGRTIFPYILGMLVAISLFRNSGVFEILAGLLAKAFLAIGVSKEIVDALPIAILRPFNAAGSRGFLIDAMRTYGADSFTGRLACVFQCAAETTFYVIAVYFGSIKVKNTRYTLGTMLLVDLICVFAAIFLCLLFF